MSVGGIFAKADVCDDEEIWEASAEEANGGDDRAAGVIGGCAEGVFSAGDYRDAKEDDGAEAFAYQRFEVGN